ISGREKDSSWSEREGNFLNGWLYEAYSSWQTWAVSGADHNIFQVSRGAATVFEIKAYFNRIGGFHSGDAEMSGENMRSVRVSELVSGPVETRSIDEKEKRKNSEQHLAYLNIAKNLCHQLSFSA